MTNQDDAQAIYLQAIDADHLEDVEDNREAVQFSVRLSRLAPEAWKHEFDAVYKQTPYTLKPPVQVDGDKLNIVFLPRYAGELPGVLNFLALIVRRANDEVRRSAEIQTSDARDRTRAEFQAALRRLSVPRPEN